MNDLTRGLATDLLLFLTLLTATAWAIAAATAWARRHRNRRNAKHRHPSNQGRCGMRPHGNPPCTRPGTEWVADQDMQAARVCRAHHDEGTVHGWWTPDAVYDQDLDVIEDHANNGEPA